MSGYILKCTSCQELSQFVKSSYSEEGIMTKRIDKVKCPYCSQLLLIKDTHVVHRKPLPAINKYKNIPYSIKEVNQLFNTSSHAVLLLLEDYEDIVLDTSMDD
ncbi:hypothetical protein [Sulfurimonas sp.]|jgi:hypothetical protein|uniref:hypothetical protein n=1 Tax=Sulfurimonas sp. TaxID=2022749 RepID=UPI0025E6F423|nr:hypothetical protein [Sulfurimonas sp.]MBT5935648.1 hypothetical protein [Sulfurimonas sp.]